MSGLQRILLLRHGETVGQSSVRYWGATDVPLSPKGRIQMALAATIVANHHLRCVYTSHLCRTREAAALVAPNVPSVPLAALNEIHFGYWEGLTRQEIASAFPKESMEWERGTAAFSYPGGESLTAFRARVEAALAQVLSDPGPEVLIIAHRGVIHWILVQLLGEDAVANRKLQIPLGSLHLLGQTPRGQWQAELLDFTDHLRGLNTENSGADSQSALYKTNQR